LCVALFGFWVSLTRGESRKSCLCSCISQPKVNDSAATCISRLKCMQRVLNLHMKRVLHIFYLTLKYQCINICSTYRELQDQRLVSRLLSSPLSALIYLMCDVRRAARDHIYIWWRGTLAAARGRTFDGAHKDLAAPHMQILIFS
jgi:hypothetical protein